MGSEGKSGEVEGLAAWRRLRDRLTSGALRLLVIGSKSALDEACRALGEPLIPVDDGSPPALALVPVGDDNAVIEQGQVSPLCGDFAYRAVHVADSGATIR